MNTFTNVLALLFVIHFLWSYYRNCYSKGYTIDFWHFSLLFSLIFIHVMLPFNRSDLNVFALGGLLRRTQAHVTEAYLISTLGYAFILFGGNLWRVKLGLGLRRIFTSVLELPARGSYFLLCSRNLLLVNGLFAVALMAGVLLYYFKTAGFGFNLRGLLLVTPWLRPIAQFSAFHAGLIGSYCLARFYLYKERSMLLIPICIVVGFLFFGERSNIFALPSMVILVLMIRMGRRLRFTAILSAVTVALFLVIFLNALREPNFSLSRALGGFALTLLYGNSFSDTRDFALILSFWDHHYFFGLTYLAGIFAFVPRFLSSFRDTWALGVVTATLAGFSPKAHPGFRVGIFGEAFLNFGLAGVMLLGAFIGATTRLIDSRMKQAVRVLPSSSLRVFSYLIIGTLIGVAENSVAASAFYSVLLIFLVSWIAQKLLRFLKLAA